MLNLIKNYSFYNLLKFQMKTNNKSLMNGLNFPLSYFEVTDDLISPDIILNIGKFIPSNNDCYIIDHKYYIKKNYFYCKDLGGNARWEVEISGFEKLPAIINFNGRSSGVYNYLASDLLAQDIILLPFIELILGLKGCLLLHGGGIIDKDNAIIFLGRGGSLKTTILMNAFKNNIKILGDERIILNIENKLVYSFPIYPQIFRYITENSNIENINISKKILLGLCLLKNNSYNDNNYNDNNLIWQKEPVNIKSIYLLKRKNGNKNNIYIHKIEKDIAIKKIIANNRAEMYSSSIPSVKRRNFIEYMTAYSFVFPDSNIATYWNDLSKYMEDVLREVSVCDIEISGKGRDNINVQIGGLSELYFNNSY